MNNCTFLGNILNDLEIKENNGTKVLKFGLGVKRDKETSDFPQFVAFGKTAELIADYHTKGSQIAVQARFQSGSYEKDGKKVYTQEFIVDKISFVNSGKKKEDKKDFMEDFEGSDQQEDEISF